MTAVYPAQVIGPDKLDTDIANSTGTVEHHPRHHNQMAKEIIAIEQTLGAMPQGDSDSVADRILELAAGELGGAGVSDQLLKAWASSGAFEITSADPGHTGPEPIDNADVLWPDGSTGVLTVTAKDDFWLAIDAFAISHHLSGKSVTQAAVTRNSEGRAITKPPLTVS